MCYSTQVHRDVRDLCPTLTSEARDGWLTDDQATCLYTLHDSIRLHERINEAEPISTWGANFLENWPSFILSELFEVLGEARNVVLLAGDLPHRFSYVLRGKIAHLVGLSHRARNEYVGEEIVPSGAHCGLVVQVLDRMLAVDDSFVDCRVDSGERKLAVS